MKETRVLVSQLVQGLDLKKYRAAYNEENMGVDPPTFDPINLTPAGRKHIVAPDVDPSIIMQVDVIFQELTTYNWNLDNLQNQDELAQDDTENINCGR